MALIKSAYGSGLQQAPVSREAGGVVVQKAAYTFNTAAASGDIIELAVLPAYHYLVSARVVDTSGATLGTIGLLSGPVGADTNTDGSARTVGTSIITAAGGLLDAGFAVDPVDRDRSIGVTLGGAVTAGAAKTLMIVLEYAQ